MRPIRNIVFRRYRAAESRIEPERGKRIAGNKRAVNSFRLGSLRQVEKLLAISGKPFDANATFGEGNKIEIRAAATDARKARRVRIRQWSQQNGVYNAEHRAIGSDSQSKG